MKETLKIRKIVNRYKAYLRLKAYLIEKGDTEALEHYKFYESATLRQLAGLKGDSPLSFKLACAMDKIILN